MEEALIALLLAGALGTAASSRVWWLTRPQASALPAVTLQTVAGGESYTMDGPDGLSKTLVQFDVWAANFTDALALARAAETDCAAPTDARFRALFVRSRRDGVEPAAGGQPAIYRASLDVEVWWITA